MNELTDLQFEPEGVLPLWPQQPMEIHSIHCLDRWVDGQPPDPRNPWPCICEELFDEKR